MANAYKHTNSRGKTYYLHTKEVTLKGDRKVNIFYFAGKVNEEFALGAIPEGYEVMENKRTGLPMLRKIKK